MNESGANKAPHLCQLRHPFPFAEAVTVCMNSARNSCVSPAVPIHVFLGREENKQAKPKARGNLEGRSLKMIMVRDG